MSDFYPHGLVAARYGVLRVEGYSERAIFIIDRQGVVRYVDVHDIDLQPDNEELFRALALIEPGQISRSMGATAPAAAARTEAHFTRPDADVVVYCTPWCPECRRVRAYLNEKGIHYVEVDISKNRSAAEQVRRYANGNETTPCFDIKGTIILNFDLPKVEKALGLS